MDARRLRAVFPPLTNRAIILNSMELPPEEREALGKAALEWCLEYFDRIADGPIYPTTSAEEMTALFAEPLPREPQAVAAVFEQFTQIAQHGRKNGHPRMFGYVQSAGSFSSAVADFLASAINQNVTSWRSAPSATTIERQVIQWIASMIGFEQNTGGLLSSGASMANFTALVTALRASTEIDVMQRGVAALGKEPRIYLSAMAHMSIPKAAGLLGLGRASTHTIPVDAAFRMDVAALDRALAEDRAAGRLPICVVGTAGDVNTGAIDPLDGIADVCARHQVWFHVDAAYGGFAALAPSVRSHFSGLARADSVALDPHKWLFAPLDAGCLLVRDAEALRRTFASSAAYMDVVADGDMSEFAFWDYGPELSRRFRALKLWFALKCHGSDAVAAAIERNIGLAGTLAAALDLSDDFERLAPVPLSIVCFRYVPPGLRKGASDDAARLAELNDVNRRLLLAIQRDGDAYLSNATIGGAFALRACLINHRTSEEDIFGLLTTIRRIAALWYPR